MANSEYYTSSEFKSTQEYKNFKAEIYAKPKEIKDNILENKDTGPETKFGNTGQKEPTKKPSTRKKIAKLFEAINKSATRLAGSVAKAVAIGTSAIVVSAGLIVPLFVEESPPPQPEPIVDTTPLEFGATINALSLNEAVVFSDDGISFVVLSDVFENSENEGFEYAVYAYDDNDTLIGKYEGKDSFLTLKCEGKPAYLEYEERFVDGDNIKTYNKYKKDDTYSPLIGVGSINIEGSTVVWNEIENEISIPLEYNISNSNIFYELTLLDKDGSVLNSYTGSDKAPKINIPAEKNVDKALLKYFYSDGQAKTMLYEKELSGALYLKSPTIEFGNKFIENGQYLIEYKILSENSENEEYLSFTIHEGVDENGYLIGEITRDTVALNTPYYFPTLLDSEISETTVFFELTMKAPYGGSTRTIKAQKTYVHEIEISHKAVCSLEYNSLTIEFYYHAPLDSYILLVNDATGEEAMITNGYYYTDMNAEDVYDFTYTLVGGDGTPLSNAIKLDAYKLPTSTPLASLNYQNPNGFIHTFNGDGTMNLYADTPFTTDDPNAFFEVDFIGPKTYTIRQRDSLVKIEDIPIDSYSIAYRIMTTIDGVDYVTREFTVSGTTTLPDIYDYHIYIDNLNYEKPAIVISNEILIKGVFELTVNDTVYSLTEDDLYYDDYYDSYFYFFDSEITSASVKMTAVPGRFYFKAFSDAHGLEVTKGEAYGYYEITLTE